MPNLLSFWKLQKDRRLTTEILNLSTELDKMDKLDNLDKRALL